MDSPDIHPSNEVERSQIHPVNQVDALLYDLAQNELKDNQRARNALKGLSHYLAAKAKLDQDYFLGKADPSMYKGLDMSLFPGIAQGVSPAYWYTDLEDMGPYPSAEVATAVGGKLGIFNQDKKSLQDYEGSDKFDRSRSGGRINIPFDGQGRVLDRTVSGVLDYNEEAPLMQLVKRYTDSGDTRPGSMGVWSVSLFLPASSFSKTLDMRIAPSKFDAQS